jgi:hypothetical protein
VAGDQEPRATRGRAKRLFLAVGALAVAVAVVLAVIIVSGGDSVETASPDPAPPSTVEPESPLLEPLSLGEEPLWTKEDSWVVRNTGGTQVRDGVMLTATPDDFALVDIATGEARWHLELGDLPGGDGAVFDGLGSSRPFLVGHGDELGVLVTYRYGHCESWEEGLALLSGKDGTVVWRTPTAPVEDCQLNHWLQELWAADDRVALVRVVPSAGQTNVANARMVAVDVRTGAKLWERPGVWPHTIAGDVALGVTSSSEPHLSTPSVGTMVSGSEWGIVDEGSVVAFDLATGEPRWELSERYPASRLVHVAGEAALVAVPVDPNGHQVRGEVVDVRTGRRIADFGDLTDDDTCASDNQALIACSVDPRFNGTVVTFQADDRSVRTAPRELSGVWALAVQSGRITVKDIGDGSYFTVDRAANPIDENAPGQLVAMAGDKAIFGSGESGRHVIEVYQVTS